METLLFIEDDDAIRLALSLALEDEGYSVREAPNGANGLASFDRDPVDFAPIYRSDFGESVCVSSRYRPFDVAVTAVSIHHVLGENLTDEASGPKQNDVMSPSGSYHDQTVAGVSIFDVCSGLAWARWNCADSRWAQGKLEVLSGGHPLDGLAARCVFSCSL